MNAELDLSVPPATAEINWNALYTDLLPRVYNFMRYRLGDSPEAEDLTATTFEKAWRARWRYRNDRGAFSTWLFTIARNVATDYYRRQQPDVSLESLPEQADPAVPERLAEQQDELSRLGALLAQLPPRERELVALKYGAGLTNRFIAKLTGLSESNVGTILHRTVQHLREQWN